VRICVYTVLLGGYDALLEQAVAADSEADFLCFSDSRDLVSKIGDDDSSLQSFNHPRDISHFLCEMSLEEIEKMHVIRVLEATRWHKGRTCEILGVSRPRLRRMIKHFEITQPADITNDDEDAVE